MLAQPREDKKIGKSKGYDPEREMIKIGRQYSVKSVNIRRRND